MWCLVYLLPIRFYFYISLLFEHMYFFQQMDWRRCSDLPFVCLLLLLCFGTWQGRKGRQGDGGGREWQQQIPLSSNSTLPPGGATDAKEFQQIMAQAVSASLLIFIFFLHIKIFSMSFVSLSTVSVSSCVYANVFNYVFKICFRHFNYTVTVVFLSIYSYFHEARNSFHPLVLMEGSWTRSNERNHVNHRNDGSIRTRRHALSATWRCRHSDIFEGSNIWKWVLL